MTVRILVLYYSRTGATRQLADAIAQGITHAGGEAIMRTVQSEGDPASARDMIVSEDDLRNCDGLIMGSPTRFGHMVSALQKFWETTSAVWVRGGLVDKPAAVFTSSSSMHGGQESTLLSMAVPLLHQGMVLCGIPYTEPAIQNTDAGGTPYGASHVDHAAGGNLNRSEKDAAVTLGERVTRIAGNLRSANP